MYYGDKERDMTGQRLVDEFNGYLLADNPINQQLIGRRAKIIDDEGYCKHLWQQEGIIQQVGDSFLSIVFDSPIESPAKSWPATKSIFITTESFILI